MANHRADLVRKAATDPKFREELLKNPNGVVEKFTGVKVPAGVKIQILEDAASVVHLVLPLATTGNELSDKTLESVVGGAGTGTQYFRCESSTDQYCMRF